MDPTIHRGALPVAEAYLAFADREARGVSGTYEDWARAVAADEPVLERIASLPPPKRQPNLVFAAARWHGARGGYDSFREVLLGDWAAVRSTVLARATQTNEAARCGVLLPFLAALPQPLALLEVGASAGLCLQPDRYSYTYDGGPRLDPAGGGSEVVVPCRLGAGVPAPRAVPEVAWRAGIDLAPVDVNDADACDWLETLVWPEHQDRRERLRGALAIARRDPPRVVTGDLHDALPALADQAPPGATLVVFHSAVLAYVGEAARGAFVDQVSRLPGHWVSNEGPGVLPQTRALRETHPGAAGQFVVSVDGVPRALASPHGGSVAGI